jgi:hypothetical protein
MVVKTKTKIMVVDFAKKEFKKTVELTNEWEVADPNQSQQQDHPYCGSCQPCLDWLDVEHFDKFGDWDK